MQQYRLYTAFRLPKTNVFWCKPWHLILLPPNHYQYIVALNEPDRQAIKHAFSVESMLF